MFRRSHKPKASTTFRESSFEPGTVEDNDEEQVGPVIFRVERICNFKKRKAKDYGPLDIEEQDDDDDTEASNNAWCWLSLVILAAFFTILLSPKSKIGIQLVNRQQLSSSNSTTGSGTTAVTMTPNVASNDGASAKTTTGGTLKQLPGVVAHYVAASGDGAVWILNDTPFVGGWSLSRHLGTNWEVIRGGAQHLSVASSNQVAAANDQGDVYTWTYGEWSHKFPGTARDVAMAKDGSLYMVNKENANAQGDGHVYKWNGSSWALVDGGKQMANRISVAGQKVVAITKEGKLFSSENGGAAWESLGDDDLVAQDVSIGQADGTIWILKDGAPSILGETPLSGMTDGVQVAAVSKDHVYVTNKKNELWEYKAT